MDALLDTPQSLVPRNRLINTIATTRKAELITYMSMSISEHMVDGAIGRWFRLSVAQTVLEACMIEREHMEKLNASA